MTESLNHLTEELIAQRLEAALRTSSAQVLADSPYLAELRRGDPTPACPTPRRPPCAKPARRSAWNRAACAC
ncbi:MAG TPA: hypothetical protein VF498_00770 [Anaerolineales bacterium]